MRISGRTSMRSVRCRNHVVSVGVLVGEMNDSGGQGGL